MGDKAEVETKTALTKYCHEPEGCQPLRRFQLDILPSIFRKFQEIKKKIWFVPQMPGRNVCGSDRLSSYAGL